MQQTQPIKHRPCPLCACTTVFFVKALRYALFDDSPLNRSSDLVACGRCGFVYCDTKSTIDDFYRHYAQNGHYLSENCGTGSSTGSERNRFAYVLSLLEKHRVDRALRIADIGSAKGGLVSFLETNGYRNLLAVDPLADCVNYMRAKGIDAETGFAECIPMEEGSADALILCHVLEHVVDLQAVMNELCRVVAVGGSVYVEVPALEYGSSFQDAPMWDFLYEHINYFSIRHLVDLFESRPFHCVESNLHEIHNGRSVVKCVSALFRKDAHASPKDFRYHDMKDAIFRILALSDKIHWPELTTIAEQQTPCYVWGISAYMQWLIANSPVGQCRILSYLDRSAYKQTKTIDGIPVQSPELVRDGSGEMVVIFCRAPSGEAMNRYLDWIGFNGKRIAI